jgi:tetratricopeptide (TPR) repeat protein
LRITAALIVRNEERFLDGCLGSLAGQVDEIVVVDTGSTDASMAIARAHGAVVIEHVWRDDFSAARNIGLDAASGDWILYVDADERLSLPEGRHLADDLGADDVIAALVRFIPRLNSTAYREYRLFRNDPRIRFEGAMHETMVPGLEAVRNADGARFVDSAATITHLGYEGDLTHKFRRNLPWLRAAIVSNPGRLYYWFDLARSLVGLGAKEEALDVAREGFARVRRGVDERNLAIGSAIADILASLLRDRGEDPLPVIEEGLRLKPDQPRLLFLKALALNDRGRLDEARPLLEQLCSIDAGSYTDATIGYDRALFTRAAPHLLGVTLLRLGRIAEASAAFSRAAASNPDAEYAAHAAVLRAASPFG